jgi:Phage endonuclease I
MAFKSGFERTVAANLSSRSLKYRYESTQFPYVLERTYNPDFEMIDHGFFIEVKGLLDRDSKAKMLAVKRQHPDADIRFLFMQADKKIPGSKQTHGQWATKNGFTWAEGVVPEEWFNEPSSGSNSSDLPVRSDT